MTETSVHNVVETLLQRRDLDDETTLGIHTQHVQDYRSNSLVSEMEVVRQGRNLSLWWPVDNPFVRFVSFVEVPRTMSVSLRSNLPDNKWFVGYGRRHLLNSLYPVTQGRVFLKCKNSLYHSFVVF